MRHRPHRALAVRADASVEHQALLPRPPAAQALRRGDREEAPFAGHAVSDTLYVGLPVHGAGWPCINESVQRSMGRTPPLVRVGVVEEEDDQ